SEQVRIDHQCDVARPTLKCVFHFVFVFAEIVDADDTSLVARYMIQHSLRDVRMHADIGHAGGNTAADIMDYPINNTAALIENLLESLPAGIAATTTTK